MYSSCDFQKHWFLYKTEGAPKGISLEFFCWSSIIPYKPYSKWFGNYHRAVMPSYKTPDRGGRTNRHTDGKVNPIFQEI